MGCTSVCTRVIIPCLFAIALYTYVGLRDISFKYKAANQDWKIVGLPRQHLGVQTFNVLCGPRCASVILSTMELIIIHPALRTSLLEMKRAEESGAVESLLCDAEARRKMSARLDEYKTDLASSRSMTSLTKILLYANAYNCLSNHAGLMKLAPAVRHVKIERPVFIVSLPRTCTTILHRTLAQDRQSWRNFDLCDILNPLPPASRLGTDARARCAERAAGMLSGLDLLFPGFLGAMESMHGFHASEADEDLGFYDIASGHNYRDMLVLGYPEQRAKPGSVSPLESVEMAEYRYAFLELAMKIFQSVDDPSAEPRPWLMKDPNHAAYLPQLTERFPDARLIFAHRSPKDITASLAKLFVVFSSAMMMPGSPGTSSGEWGQETVKRMDGYVMGVVNFTIDHAKYNAEGLAVARASGATKRLDFQFQKLAQDVPAHIRIIYEKFLGKLPSAEAENAFHEYLDKYDRKKTGKQPRALTDFGLSDSDFNRC